VHLPGIAGTTDFDKWWVTGLGEGGVGDHLEVYDWTRPNVWIPALYAYDHNRSEARVIATRIAAKLRKDPEARIVLTAWSGGCQVAVWALENLPEEVKVQSLMLVAPSITPTYDLSRALRHVRGSLFTLTSPGDFVVLGLGTSLFGTSDGTHSLAAGLVGFARPESGDRAEYRKVRQMPWDLAWMQYGDFGDHTGGMGKDFAKHVLAPMLREDQRRLTPQIQNPVNAIHAEAK
jgi:pimeloyl-ACP methyl ester carboxylesterase